MSDEHDLSVLREVATRYNWAHVAPPIFGTLFERSLDPARRSLSHRSHYSSEEDIRLLIEPVVMCPPERRWAHLRASILVTLGLPAEILPEVVILTEGQNLGGPPSPPQPSKGVIPSEAPAPSGGVLISHLKCWRPRNSAGKRGKYALQKYMDAAPIRWED